MTTFRCHFQHCLNPLHVYCRLREWGLSVSFALRVTGAYERLYRTCLCRPNCEPPASE